MKNYGKNRLFFRSLIHGPRKHILIVATDQPIQSSTNKTPALLAFFFFIFVFHFLPWEKGNMWSKLESSKALVFPLNEVFPLLLLLWIGTWLAEIHLYRLICVIHSNSQKIAALLWVLFCFLEKISIPQMVMFFSSCHYDDSSFAFFDKGKVSSLSSSSSSSSSSSG